MALSRDVISWLEEPDASVDSQDVTMLASRVSARLRDQGILEAEIKEIVRTLAPLEFYERSPEKSPWKSHFAPRSSVTEHGGEYPRLADLTEAHVEEWAYLAASLRRPIVRARFADAVWELGKRLGSARKDLYRYGLLGAEMYLSAAEGGYQRNPFSVLHPAVRSINLAIKFRNEGLLTKGFDFLMSFVEAVDVAHVGLWSVPFDKLLGVRGLGTARQLQILGQYEKFFRQTVAGRDLFRIEISGPPIAKYFSDHRQYQRAQEITLLYGETLLELADELGDPSFAAHHLGVVLDAYRRVGLRDHEERVRLKLEAKGKDVIASMKSHYVEIEFNVEEIKKSLAETIDVSHPLIALYRLANSCAPKPVQIRTRLDSSDYIAHRLIPTGILGDHGLTVGTVGTYDHDQNGRITMEVAREMNLGATLFLMGLEEWKKKFELGALPDMPDLLNAMLIPSDRVSIYLEGIEAFEKRDYLKCIHVLVPQVENSLRALLTLLDIPVTKTDEDGNFELKNMNDVLRNDCVHQALEEKLWNFLKVLYIDKRGMNLRNVVAHGMAPLEAFHRVNAALVIQSVVFLTMIREEAIMFSDEEFSTEDNTEVPLVDTEGRSHSRDCS